jgi:hypothetical protein
MRQNEQMTSALEQVSEPHSVSRENYDFHDMPWWARSRLQRSTKCIEAPLDRPAQTESDGRRAVPENELKACLKMERANEPITLSGFN